VQPMSDNALSIKKTAPFIFMLLVWAGNTRGADGSSKVERNCPMVRYYTLLLSGAEDKDDEIKNYFSYHL
jgi:hypothetical protein